MFLTEARHTDPNETKVLCSRLYTSVDSKTQGSLHFLKSVCLELLLRFCLSLLEKSNASFLHGSFDRFSLWLWRTFKIYFHRPLQRSVFEMVMCLFMLSMHPDCTKISILPRKGVSWTTPAKCRGKQAVSRGGVAGNSSLYGSGAVMSRCFESFSDTSPGLFQGRKLCASSFSRFWLDFAFAVHHLLFIIIDKKHRQWLGFLLLPSEIWCMFKL